MGVTLNDLTASQLWEAATIKEKIQTLQNQLHRILSVPATKPNEPARKRRKMSASARRKIAAAQKARWAKVKKAKG